MTVPALPIISVVTISFNQARYIATAIESVIGQDYPALDYIVVDPGSTDGSRDIIAGYGDLIATRLLDPDNGPADGLNKGFAAARGSIFGFINADDLLLPGALARVAAAFADPAVDVVLGNGVVIDDTDRHIRNAQSSRFSRVAYGHGAMTFIQQGCFFRAEAFARVGGFNAANRTSWDAELLIDMAVAGARIVNIPDRLGAFRLYGDTITGSGRLAEAMRIDVARIAAKALGRPPRWHDALLRPLHLLARRLANPRATLDGVRARLAGGG
ncbi:MAG TPA: glycosyltransferase family 2 protein [Polymorphobacter sp.]|nr:glycosyltransferase family 2 protein [Polymorphobacter sp.]